MIREIKELLIRSNAFLRLVKMANNLFYTRTFEKEAIRRESLSLFDYNSLARPIKRYYADFVPENNDKCMSICLKKYMGIKENKSINALIEHGLFFGDFVSHAAYAVNVPTIITFGSTRVKHLTDKGVNKSIIPIGPYIHYASPYLSEDGFKTLKSELGRVLLVFPSHSLASEGSVASYNLDEFGEEIDMVAKNYDSVLISLHFNDINLADQYAKKGYRCVSSGHSDDPSFMRRQRTLIELSDMTMSNAVGTHLGYCVYLNKPHYLFKQRVTYTQNDDIKKRAMKWRDWDIFKEETDEIIAAFNKYSSNITERQKEVVNKYWGTEFIRKPDELKMLLTL